MFVIYLLCRNQLQHLPYISSKVSSIYLLFFCALLNLFLINHKELHHFNLILGQGIFTIIPGGGIE